MRGVTWAEKHLQAAMDVDTERGVSVDPKEVHEDFILHHEQLNIEVDIFRPI